MFYCLDHLLKTYNPFVCFTKWYCVKVKVKCRIWLINWSIFVTYFVSKLKEVLSHYIGILSCRWFHVYTVQGEPRLTFIIKWLSTKLYFNISSTFNNPKWFNLSLSKCVLFIISYLFGSIVVNLSCKNSHYYTVQGNNF